MYLLFFLKVCQKLFQVPVSHPTARNIFQSFINKSFERFKLSALLQNPGESLLPISLGQRLQYLDGFLARHEEIITTNCGPFPAYSSPSANRPNWAAGSRVGASSPRCLKAAGVKMRPRGVRWMKPCCNK